MLNEDSKSNFSNLKKLIVQIHEEKYKRLFDRFKENDQDISINLAVALYLTTYFEDNQSLKKLIKQQ